MVANLGSSVHFKDIMFWGYFGSRCLIIFMVWVLVTTQNLLLDVDEVLVGMLLFFFMVGLIQNFTLKLGAYDVGGLLKVFGGLRDRVLKNAEDRAKEKEMSILRAKKSREREVQMNLEERYSLEALVKILYSAFAYANISGKEREKEMEKLGEQAEGLTDEHKKPFYAAKIIHIGGIEFAEEQLHQRT